MQTWDELDRSGGLQDLKDNNYPAFKEVFYNKWGRYPDTSAKGNKPVPKATNINLSDTKPAMRPVELFRSWDELDRTGKLQDLKDNNYTLFSTKWREKFGKFPQNFQDKVDFALLSDYDKTLRKYPVNLSDENADQDRHEIPAELFIDKAELDNEKFSEIRANNYSLFLVLHKLKFGFYGEIEFLKADFYLIELYEDKLYEKKQPIITGLSDEKPEILTKEKLAAWKQKANNLSDGEEETYKIPPNKNAIPPECLMSWKELLMTGKLLGVWESNYTLFCVKYYDRFGQMPFGEDDRVKMDHHLAIIYRQDYNRQRVKVLEEMDWEDLLKKFLTAELLKLNPAAYKEKYTKYYGTSPVGM